ncbi:predicted pectin lyase [Alteracholeplasma palmae J233]|uniref:Predicted pectin lyase n=1 Tax=Alteracholeplasma palmae (strain ATCC 49389 / J233) TaxID=1318466 RepID=U4KLB7_ALTPJ|nr:immunoglobulin-like domain-containing protein [Alteracholeplasma palmae]CCV64583.1 predicted pectin lyase [Alteracholeplasma palmae J233]
MKKVLALFLLGVTAILLASCGINNEQKIDEIFDSITLPTETKDNIVLIEKSEKYPDAKFTWTSNNTSSLTSKGVVNRKEVDVTVQLFLLVELNSAKKTKTYSIKVLKDDKEIVIPTIDYKQFNNPYGFASLGITDRTNAVAKEVSTEIEFLETLENKENKVIKITKDLNMGYLNVVKNLKAANKDETRIKELTENNSLYRRNPNIPMLHPVLIEEGVGQLILDGREDLMIYSENGITIKHLTTHIKGNSKNIVIRNIKFADIWEWDEKDRGQYKENDWDYFTLENVNGLWFDHLSFSNSYDGIIDAKNNVENVTLSYLDLNFVVTDFITVQMDMLENNRTEHPYYDELRNSASKEDITIVAASQKKGFNFGNTTDGSGFENITVTMHHIYAKNLQDRFPRLRKGDVHLYNVISDATDISKLRNIGIPIVSQAIVPTEQGAVLMENSVFKNIAEAIKTHQDSNLDSRYTGKYKVINSYHITGETVYKGSSDDENTLWIQSNTNAAKQPFYFRNWQTIPYKYLLEETAKLEESFDKNQAGVVQLTDFDWLKIDISLSENSSNRGQMILPEMISLDKVVLVKKADTYVPNFKVINFYGNKELLLNTDYTYTTNLELDTTVPGKYEIEYIITSKTDSTNIIKIVQTVIVYDETKENEIYAYNISDEQNEMINISLNLYMKKGNLHYLITDLENLSQDDILNHQDKKLVEINDTSMMLENIQSNRKKYIYLITETNELYSQIIKYDIVNEEVIEITTEEEFNQMLSEPITKGKYYKLMNNLDFTGKTMSISTIFEGVLDGNGFKVMNLTEKNLRKGIFEEIKNGVVKNITFENIKLTELNKSDRNGLLSGAISGKTTIYNIEFNKIEITAKKNKLGLITGEIRLDSRVEINNIKITDVKLSANKLTAFLVGELGSLSKVIIKDIYMDVAIINAPSNEGAGLIANMVTNSNLDISNVYATNIHVSASHNVGFIAGKVNSEVRLNANNIFVELITYEMKKANYNTMVGNNDGISTLGEKVFLKGITKKDGNKGLGESTYIANDIILDETWFTENLKDMLDSESWKYQDNGLILK